MIRANAVTEDWIFIIKRRDAGPPEFVKSISDAFAWRRLRALADSMLNVINGAGEADGIFRCLDFAPQPRQSPPPAHTGQAEADQRNPEEYQQCEGDNAWSGLFLEKTSKVKHDVAHGDTD